MALTGYTNFDPRGYHVVDAVVGMMVNTNEADLQLAVPLDHNRCGMAQSIIRSAGVGEDDVIIEATMTHVLMPCEAGAAKAHNAERPEADHVRSGERVWMRFENSHALRDAIEALDTGGEFPATVYTLHPVPFSSRLMQKRIRAARLQVNKKAGKVDPVRSERAERARSRYHRPCKTRLRHKVKS